MNVEKISTSWLVNAARRSAALKTLYANADIKAEEYTQAKRTLRAVLESEMCIAQPKEEL